MTECRNCGQPIRTERRRHGRDTAVSLWAVHTATDRVPCDPGDVRNLRAAQRATGHTHRDESPSTTPVPETDDVLAPEEPGTAKVTGTGPRVSSVNDWLNDYFD